MVDSGKALRTALPEFGQKLEMERKREEEGTSAESQVLNSLTLPSFALFFFFLLFRFGKEKKHPIPSPESGTVVILPEQNTLQLWPWSREEELLC